MAEMMPSGTVRCGSWHSSATFSVSSKPMKEKKVRIAPWSRSCAVMPAPEGVSNRLAAPHQEAGQLHAPVAGVAEDQGPAGFGLVEQVQQGGGLLLNGAYLTQ